MIVSGSSKGCCLISKGWCKHAKTPSSISSSKRPLEDPGNHTSTKKPHQLGNHLDAEITGQNKSSCLAIQLTLCQVKWLHMFVLVTLVVSSSLLGWEAGILRVSHQQWNLKIGKMDPSQNEHSNIHSFMTFGISYPDCGILSTCITLSVLLQGSNDIYALNTQSHWIWTWAVKRP